MSKEAKNEAQGYAYTPAVTPLRNESFADYGKRCEAAAIRYAAARAYAEAALQDNKRNER